MIDYEKLKKGDEVMVDLHQSAGKLFPGVVQSMVAWKTKKHVVGFVRVQVAHHSDASRELVIHSRHGTNRGYDELHPPETKNARPHSRLHQRALERGFRLSDLVPIPEPTAVYQQAPATDGDPTEPKRISI